MRLQERDIVMLASIFNFRFLTTRQIHLLHGGKGVYGEKVTRRKLLELERNGYVKSWQPSKYEQKIFYLTQKGAEEVAVYCGYEKIKLAKKSSKTLHQVMLSEIYVRLRLEQSGRLRMFALDTPIGNSVADAFIRYDIGKRSKLLFLEADRGTESITHIKDVKLKGYKAGYEGGDYQKKFGIFPDVCFVTTSDVRKRSLLRIAEAFPFRVRVFMLEEVTSCPLLFIT